MRGEGKKGVGRMEEAPAIFYLREIISLVSLLPVNHFIADFVLF